MHVVILLIIVFFNGLGHPPEAYAKVVPDIETCQTLGAQLKTDLPKDPKVQGVDTLCMEGDAPPASAT